MQAVLTHTERDTLPDTLDKNFQEGLEMHIKIFPPKGIQLTAKKYFFSSINMVYMVMTSFSKSEVYLRVHLS